MKIQKRLNRNFLLIVLFVLFTLFLITGCGDISGGASTTSDTAGAWDQMHWDDSNWQ